MAKRHSAEEIVNKLRQADVELAKGQAVASVCKLIGISDHTYFRCPDTNIVGRRRTDRLMWKTRRTTATRNQSAGLGKHFGIEPCNRCLGVLLSQRELGIPLAALDAMV